LATRHHKLKPNFDVSYQRRGMTASSLKQMSAIRPGFRAIWDFCGNFALRRTAEKSAEQTLLLTAANGGSANSSITPTFSVLPTSKN
jgi:hypothetical protein